MDDKGRVVAFHHVGITVQSLDRALAFYHDILGFAEVFRWNPSASYIETLVGTPGVDLHAVILELPGTGARLELLEYRAVQGGAIEPVNSMAGTCHIAFRVDSLDPLYGRLRAAGVPCVSAPVTPTIGPNMGGRAVYMIDPDGVRVEFIETRGTFDDFAAAGRC